MLSWLQRLDHQLFFAVNQGLSTPLLDYLLWGASMLAHGGVLIALVGVGLWYVDRQAVRQHLGWILVALLLGGLAAQLLKYQLDRPRPLNEFAALIQSGAVQINVIGHHLNHRSFPSGHTQGVASVFLYLAMLYPKRWYWYGGGLFLVALSRVYLGVHFPSDVVAGAVIGGICGLLAWRIRSYLKPGDEVKASAEGEREMRLG